LPFPINIRTVNLLFGLNFSEQIELEEFFKSKSEYKKNIVTIEDYVVSKLGRELYELFFRDYSLKQWGIDPGKIDASVAARIPVRTNFDDRYFTDKYQFMPQDGYTKLFERLLSHRSIEIALNTDYEDVSEKLDFKTLIFTGPIDSYFKYQLGRLKYRSLNFSYQTVDQQYVQEVAVINYPNDFDYTRTTEFKHLTGQNHHQTTIMYEFPSSTGDPYYPVKNSETNTLLGHYEKLSRTMNNVHFVGRLGTFQYLNMDQVVGQSLKMFEKLKTL
jgi:UDP-galactopyranose mutase